MASPDDPTIRLDQFLKLRGAADSGGHAKVLVQGGKVKVNGEVDLRRGRKLRAGDVVLVGGATLPVTESELREE
jgi:ribosome-associated protein